MSAKGRGGSSPDHVMLEAWVAVCAITLGGLVLLDDFWAVPSALVALAAAWYVLRM